MKSLVLSALLVFLLLGCSGDSISPTQSENPMMSGSPGPHGYKYNINIVPKLREKGTMAGFWVKNDVFAHSGYFDGFWLDNNSDTIAHLNGIFWQEEDTLSLFEGQVTGYVTDEVIAHLSGKWFYDDYRMCPMCGTGHGQFYGRVDYLDGGFGKIRGEFGDYSLPYEENALPLTGAWYSYTSGERFLF